MGEWRVGGWGGGGETEHFNSQQVFPCQESAAARSSGPQSSLGDHRASLSAWQPCPRHVLSCFCFVPKDHSALQLWLVLSQTESESPSPWQSGPCWKGLVQELKLQQSLDWEQSTLSTGSDDWYENLLGTCLLSRDHWIHTFLSCTARSKS